MPNREDEYWASQKEGDLKYCYKHKRYYKAEIGCQICYLEELNTGDKVKRDQQEIKLVKCPRCLEISLFWISQNDIYECMNKRCRLTFKKEELETEIKRSQNKTTGKAWFGNQYFDLKKKKWRKP